MTPLPPALRIADLTKSFGPTRALRGADLEVAAGTVHALLGGNGSGKSTLVKILAGVHQADGGTIELNGQQLAARMYRAADGHRHGLRFVHQDLGLIDTATVAENMAFTQGFPTRALWRVGWRALHERTDALLREYEIDAEATTPLALLRPADRTMVAIARALSDPTRTPARDAGSKTDADAAAAARAVLVLDEPTASLPRHESELLLGAVRRRAQQGQTVLLISHHLGEVLEVADEISVFRDGRTAGRLTAADAGEDAIVRLMAGREVISLRRREPDGTKDLQTAVPDDKRTGLTVRGLAAGPLVDVDLDVRAGEIVGVGGLLGSGRTSLVRAVFGDLKRRGGTVQVNGQTLSGRGTAESIVAGVALVPEDRAADAAFLDHTVSDNLSAAVVGSYWRTGVMRMRRQRRDATDLAARFGVRTEGVDGPLSQLSGGNQQKTVLARWLRRKPRVLLLDEPTQGVDVISRGEIYRVIREVAEGGCAVLIASSDAEELSVLCDRVLILAGGRVVEQVGNADLDPDLLVRLTQTREHDPLHDGALQPSNAGGGDR